jgi:hypothetical protein
MMEQEPVVFIVDDDAAVRKSWSDWCAPWVCGGRRLPPPSSSCGVSPLTAHAVWCWTYACPG